MCNIDNKIIRVYIVIIYIGKFIKIEEGYLNYLLDFLNLKARLFSSLCGLIFLRTLFLILEITERQFACYL